MPQVLVNVRHRPGLRPMEDAAVADAVAAAEAGLAGRGRILVRASGTEPLVRVMAEGEDAAEVRAAADRLADVVRARSAG